MQYMYTATWKIDLACSLYFILIVYIFLLKKISDEIRDEIPTLCHL